MVLTNCEQLDYGVIMKYKKSQLVKSSTSDNVYWIVNVNDNIYTAEDAWGETYDDFCDDDFTALTIHDDLRFRLRAVNH